MDRRFVEVQNMLGQHTPAEFVKLSLEERNALYRRYLVTDKMVRIEEGDDEYSFNPELATRVILRQQYYTGDDSAGKQIAREAREVYFTQKTFTMRSHWLCEFLVDTLADGTPLRVESLIRNIIIIVDTEHIHDSAEIESSLGDDETEPLAVRDLKQLFALTNATWIGVDIRGGGALDGSDLRTQLKIKEISGVIKQLIVQFPQERFGIKKIQLRPRSPHATFHDLKPYWKPPTAQTKENLRQCRASFEELMQIQIAEWTRETSDRITTEDFSWQSLL